VGSLGAGSEWRSSAEYLTTASYLTNCTRRINQREALSPHISNAFALISLGRASLASLDELVDATSSRLLAISGVDSAIVGPSLRDACSLLLGIVVAEIEKEKIDGSHHIPSTRQ
jgi:hypothetical protein